MRHPTTVYRGERILGPGMEVIAVRVTVDGRELTPRRSLRVINHSPSGFEWGYRGSGPSQLALGLVLDATGGDADTARASYQFVRDALVSGWAGDTWQATAAEVIGLVERAKRERHAEPACGPAARCRVCDCTEDDCRQCVEADGVPCSWVEPDLCSRCARVEAAAAEGGGS